MTDISDYIAKTLPSFFWGNDPKVNQQLRQRIALQLMASKRAYPKNVGEGISAIGEALGERSLASRLEQSDVGAQEQAAKIAGSPGTAPPSERSSYAPSDDTTDTPPAPATAAITGAVTPASMPPTPPPPPPSADAGPPPPASSALPPSMSSALSASPPTPFATIRTRPDGSLGNLTTPFDETPPPPRPVPPQRQGAITGVNPALATRANIAMLLSGQGGPGGPPPNPTLAAAMPPPSSGPGPGQPPADQRLALATLPPDSSGTMTDIQPAPPVPPQIRQLPPPVQVAQAGQADVASPGYVPPERDKPKGAPIIPMSAEEIRLNRLMIANQGNPYVAAALAPQLQQAQRERETRQAEANKLFEAEVTRGTRQTEMHQQALMTQAERMQTYQKGAQGIIAGAPPGTPGTPAMPGAQMAGPGVPQPVDPRLGTPQSPQRNGIPNAGPVPTGITPQQHAEQMAPIVTKDVQAAEAAVPAFQRSIALINTIRNHPGREWGTGITARVAGEMPGTSAFAYNQALKELQGKEFLQGYAALRGSGSISNAEGEKTTGALMARVNAAQSKEEMDIALNTLEKNIRSDMETTERKVNRPVTAWRGEADNAGYAPDIGQRGTRRGRLVEYIGGNPGVDASYRPVQ